MSLISSNYNVLQVSLEDAEKYKVGQVFEVPEYYRNRPRFMVFDGMVIESISFGFGAFLHFNFMEWGKRKNKEDEAD